MFAGVGGSTILYNADWCRLRPSDFRVRTLDGVADDWPISYAELAPHFDRTDVEFGVCGLAGDPSLPPTPAFPHPPLPVGPGGRLVARAHDDLGWHWWPGTNAISPAACVQWGTCLEGCPAGAKASADLTHWRRAVAGGADLRTGARATRVVVDARGRASGVEYVDRDGRSHVAEAPVVVLAANGIGTPRLLLLSGLANRSGLVGRRPHGASVRHRGRDVRRAAGVVGRARRAEDRLLRVLRDRRGARVRPRREVEPGRDHRAGGDRAGRTGRGGARGTPSGCASTSGAR